MHRMNKQKLIRFAWDGRLKIHISESHKINVWQADRFKLEMLWEKMRQQKSMYLPLTPRDFCLFYPLLILILGIIQRKHIP